MLSAMPRRGADGKEPARPRRAAAPGGADRRRLALFLKSLRLPPLLDPPPFPDPADASAEGLVGFTVGLTPEQVLAAYRVAIFPMADPYPGLIGWWSPEPRAVLELDALHVPRRLQRTVRSGRFEVRVDTACAQVVEGCAARDETWISQELGAVYLELHRRGVVHSVETWLDGKLAGGLYGVHIGGAFMAESMFHLATDASKVAVVALVERLRARGFRLLDIQQKTGATSIFQPLLLSRGEYCGRLAAAVELERTFEDPRS